MNNLAFMQIYERFARISAKAMKCRALGAVENVSTNIHITSPEVYRFDIQVDKEGNNVAWYAWKNNYKGDEDLHANTESANVLESFLDEKIDSLAHYAEQIKSVIGENGRA